MPSPSARLSRRIASRHGVVSRSELIDDGFTEHSIRRQVTAGVLVSMHRGVFRLATSTETFETRCRIDTVNELEYFLNCGILQYVLRKLAA